MSSTAIVQRIDHVFVPLFSPATALRLLRDQLGLPLAWPLADYGGFSSGAVSLGNANLELVMHSELLPAFVASSSARVQGIVFHPGHIDDAWMEELDRREIGHDSPTMFGPADHPLFTNVVFSSVMDPPTMVFASEYHQPRMTDIESRRSELGAAGGGRLGLYGLAEVVVGAIQPEAAAAGWQRLLDPLQPVAPGLWRIGEGPSLRLVEARADVVETLVLEVHSPSVARSALAAAGAGALCGLDLRFV
jgi:hypothetical protein